MDARDEGKQFAGHVHRGWHGLLLEVEHALPTTHACTMKRPPELAQGLAVGIHTRYMSKGKTPREDATHWVNEHHWTGSAPGCNLSAQRSRTSRDSGADVAMTGAGVAAQGRSMRSTLSGLAPPAAVSASQRSR
ncbi:hypothetical protein B0H13DRAFT_1899635 [Mycena leptocephala]|nr:hypothetical protein B0H13DRAFT_1899635 [Mycena leptocephala]